MIALIQSGSFVWDLFFSCSVVSDFFVTPWTVAHHSSLSFTISQSLLRLMSFESVMPSNHLILCHPLLLPSILPSISFFSNESALCIRWPKYWSFTFSISPSNEQSGLISWLLGGCHLTVCSCELFMILQRGGDRQQAPWYLFHKGINPILGGANTHDIF